MAVRPPAHLVPAERGPGISFRAGADAARGDAGAHGDRARRRQQLPAQAGEQDGRRHVHCERIQLRGPWAEPGPDIRAAQGLEPAHLAGPFRAGADRPDLEAVRLVQGCDHHADQSAADPRPRPRQADAGAQPAAPDGGAGSGPRAGAAQRPGRQPDVQDQRRPRESGGARRRAHRRRPDVLDRLGLALRQQLPRYRQPHQAGVRAGRCALSHEPGGPEPPVRAQQQGCHGAVLVLRHRPMGLRTAQARALQRRRFDGDPGAGGGRPQHRAGDGLDGGAGEKAARWNRIRMDRHLAAAAALRRTGAAALCTFDPGGVLEPRGALRKLVDPHLGDHGGALWRARRARRGDYLPHAERRVLHGGPAHDNRPVGEERHPDRRVRARAARRGQERSRRRGPRRPHADAPDRHDLHGLRAGRAAPRARQRRGLAQPERDRHRRAGRNAGRDLPGHVHDPDVLRPRHRQARAQAEGQPRTSRLMKRFFLVTSVIALAACSTMQPAYERPAAPVAGEFPAGAAYAASATGGTPATGIGWRDFLTDPRLRRLVEIALANNRDLRVAMLNVAQVQAQYRIQRAALAPQVSGFADGSHSRTPGSLSKSGTPLLTHAYETGVSVAWEVDLFGRLRSLSDAALEQYFATAYARQAAEILLVSQVADQYLTTLAFDEQLAVTRQTLETAQASYTIVKLQFDTGTAPELTLQQALSVVEQANANYAAQVRARAQAENGLVLLIGEPLPADLPPALPMGEQKILADIPAGLPSDLLTRRPDILQAEALLRSENADIGAARAAFFPRISLTGSLGTASATLGGLFGGGSQAWAFLPSITVPIFEGGALRANLDAAKIRKDIGIAQYEKAIQAAFREVADGLAARGTYDEQLAAQERYTATQQRSLELAQFRYRNGIDSYLNVLTAQTGLYGAQQTLVATRLQRLTSLVDLYRALGGGWIEHTGDEPRPADGGVAMGR